MRDAKCPECGGTELRQGEIQGGGEFGNLPAGPFVPIGVKTLRLSRGIDMQANFWLCLSCGLLWQKMGPQELARARKFIEAHHKA